MNNGFIKLSNNKYVSSDENGTLYINDYKNNQKEILLKENEIELIDNKIIKLNDELRHQKDIISDQKTFLKIIPICILLSSLTCFILGAITSNGDIFVSAISAALRNLHVFLPISAIGTIQLCSVILFKNNKVKKLKKKINNTKDLKQYYEKELSDFLKINNYEKEKNNILINKPVSLVEETNNIERELNNELDYIYKIKERGFVRKRI